MLKAYEKDEGITVDIFINDVIPTDVTEGKLEAYVFIADPDSHHKKFTVTTHQGELTFSEAEKLFEKYEKRKMKRDSLRIKARKENLQTILSLIKDDLDAMTEKKVEEAMKPGFPHTHNEVGGSIPRAV